jgi:hypothetical protein
VFRLPESFEPTEFLRSPKLLTLADDARYFVSLILTKLARRDVDSDGRVRLMAKYLRRVMHKRHYKAVVDALLERGVVTRSPYAVGIKAFGFMLADRFRFDKHIRVPATCPRLIGRLQSFHEQAETERRSRMLPVHFGLERQQWQLEIDGETARDILKTIPPESNPYDVQGVLVSDIEQRDFHINVGHYGRISNNISSMKRELREALRHNGEPLSQVDVKCCQPALLGQLVVTSRADGTDREPRNKTNTRDNADRDDRASKGTTHNGSKYDAPVWAKCDDLARYCELVQSGTFYEFMLASPKIRSCPNLTREQLKRQFLADVLAKKKANDRGAEYPSVVEDCFREWFPSPYRFIRRFNNDGWEHANLIRELQRQESKLVIETVAADLLTRHPRLFLISLHDALFTTARGVPAVVDAFETAFERSGFPMKLKID